jgi:hypothetical protein
MSDEQYSILGYLVVLFVIGLLIFIGTTDPLVICNNSFKYNDRVRIINGFYKGRWSWIRSKSKCYYTLDKFSNKEFHADDLEFDK